MRATDNGFLYNSANKVVIAEIFEGNEINLPTTSAIFYGTKVQAIDFGLKFEHDEEII